MTDVDVATLFKTIADSFAALSELYTSETGLGTRKADSEPRLPAAEPSDTNETTIYHSEEVRAALGRKAQEDGRKYRAEVKALVKRYSSDGTFIKVPAEKYPELMKELKELGGD